MCCTGFIKRFLPFALTFAAGLFIASFFMPIGFSRSGSHHRGNHRNEFRELQMKYEKSEEENIRLRNQLDELKMNGEFLEHSQVLEIPGEMDFDIPPPPVAPAAPPRRR